MLGIEKVDHVGIRVTEPAVPEASASENPRTGEGRR